MARGEKTERARELVDQLGISEPTAWRWLARHPGYAPEDFSDRRCGGCGQPLTKDATIRREYCDSYCRVKAYRRRKARERIAQLRAASRSQSQV